MISFPARILPRRMILKLLNRLKAGRASREEATCIAEYDTGGPMQIAPYDFYFPPRKIEFEGRICNVPNRIEDYLTRIYGGISGNFGCVDGRAFGPNRDTAWGYGTKSDHTYYM